MNALERNRLNKYFIYFEYYQLSCLSVPAAMIMLRQKSIENIFYGKIRMFEFIYMFRVIQQYDEGTFRL